jgi:amidase
VITGKLSTPELAILPVAETNIAPPTRNPWDLATTAGGSSSGSGAAVASRMLAVAAGSDGAGSIRIPSALNGLVGLKTTRGLVPNPHATFERIGISVIGPMARSAGDAAALLDLLMSHPGTGPYLLGLNDAPQGQRVAVSTTSSILATHPDAVTAVHRVAAVMAELGHHVEDGPPLDGTVAEFLPIYQHIIARTPVLSPRRLESTTTWLRETGKAITAGQATAARDAIAWKVHTLLAPWDLWLTPAVAVATPRVAEAADLQGQARFDRLAELGIWTAPLNASGNPAISIPVVVNGRPWGVQLAGRLGQDGQLLAHAHAILTALGTPVVPTPPAYA